MKTGEQDKRRKILLNLLEEIQNNIEVGDIAIIGMSGRYPEAENLKEYWDILKTGQDCIQKIPEDRWDADKFYHPDRKNPNTYYTRYGGFLKHVDEFDPMFFNISQVEAEVTDPQERIFLETAWEAIEDSGYTRNNVNRISQKTGVFVGVMNGNYDITGGEEWAKRKVIGANSAAWSIANRISYYFDLQGPSMAVNTACSSSLTAIHLAVNSLRKEECEMAIAGGVNLILHPAHFSRLCKMEMLSEKEYLSAFGNDADGFVDGEGSGAIVLKPLKKALEDKDRIYGVIKGSFINAGGKTSGYTVPNPKSQKELIKKAITNSKIDPRTISYVEAHGTGTRLGDPIEIRGLTQAYESFTKDRQFCAIGSVKANIGHLESAAGIAGIHKILLQMMHKKLVPSIHAETINQEIDFDESPFTLQKEYADWKRPSICVDGKIAEVPRRAGISSFGAGGANVHMVLEEFEQVKAKGTLNGYQENVMLLSARDLDRLREYAINVREYLSELSGSSGFDELYSLQTGREFMEERLAITGKSMSDILSRLSDYCQGKENIEGVYTGSLRNQKNLNQKTDKAEEAYVRKDIRVLAKLWTEGFFVDFRKLYKVLPNRISVPTYPFAKEKCWVEISDETKTTFSSNGDFDNVSDINGLCFEKVILGDEKFVKDHVIGGNKLVPAALQMELAGRAAKQVISNCNITAIENVLWGFPILVQEEKKIRIKLKEKKKGYLDYQIVSEDDEHTELIHSCGTIIYLEQTEEKKNIKIPELIAQLNTEITGGQLYETFRKQGYQYGSSLSVIQKAYWGEGKVLSVLKVKTENQIDTKKQVLHPAVIDAAFQTLALVNETSSEEQISMPLALTRLSIYKKSADTCYVYVSRSSQGEFTLRIADENGEMLVEMTGMKLSEMKTRKTTKTVTGTGRKEEGYEQAEQLIKDLIHGETKISFEKLKPDTELDKYGIDSVMIMRFTTKLEEKLGDVSRTLFFEKRTIRELAVYLSENYSEYFSQNVSKETDFVEFEPAMDLKTGWNFQRQVQELDTVIADEEVAIIGLDGKYPMADDLKEFWKNLCEGKDCITEIGKERWNHESYFSVEKGEAGKTYTKWGGFISDYDKFDPLFFNISPVEAEMMDPQERVFLESAWKVVEDAGYSKSEISKSTVGVFAGAMYGQYQMIGAEQFLLGNKVAPLSNFSTIANRVSYFMDLRGPSMAVDTMCSSSLTSVYLACQAIKNGDCEMAIAGGVNLSIHPSKYVLLSSTKFMASDGRCRSFGEGGDGYVPGEGVGSVLLKSLKKAEADGDHIYGVIKGAALNHEGKTNGYTVPDPVAQSKVIKKAFDRAGIDASTVSCIEAHGTGTMLGDPIEVTGLNYVFKEYTDKEHFCAVGSVKSNIGHLESAAGIAAISKVLLEMKYKKIVPSIHSEKLNPMIKFEHTPFYVPQNLEDWEGVKNENGEVVRRAGISGFGAGGSNVHIIIEDYHPKEDMGKVPVQEVYLIPLSAKDKEQLLESSKNMKKFLLNADSVLSEENGMEQILQENVAEDVAKILSQLLDIEADEIKGDMTFLDIDVDRVTLLGFVKLVNAMYGEENFSGEPLLGDSIENFVAKLIKSKKQSLTSYYHIEVTKEKAGASIADIAFTLQIGRENMAERVCFAVKDKKDFIDALSAFLQGNENSSVCYGNARKGEKNLQKLYQDTEESDYINSVIENADYKKLASLWVQGAVINWKNLYHGQLPKRISLPTYPFANERIWIPNMIDVSKGFNYSEIEKLHPFLDCNQSTLCHQKFATRFDKQNTILKDHKFHGSFLVPGAVLLEMARAAGEISLEGEVREIRDIVWCVGVECKENSLDIITEIKQTENQYTFTISSQEEGVLYSNGTIAQSFSNRQEQLVMDKVENLKYNYTDHIKKEEYYKLLGMSGLEYGSSLRVIEEITVREHDHLFARINATQQEQEEMAKCKLNPVVVDAAFQCVAALVGKENSQVPFMPIGIEEVCIYDAVPQQCFVYIEAGKTDNRIQQYDVYILSENGKVYIKIHNFKIGRIGDNQKDDGKHATWKNSNVIYMSKEWKEAALPEYRQKPLGIIVVFDSCDGFLENLKNKVGLMAERIISIRAGQEYHKIDEDSYEMNPSQKEDIKCILNSLKEQNQMPSVYIHRWSLDAQAESGNQMLQEGLYTTFYLCRNIMRDRMSKNVRFLYFYDGNDTRSYAANAGMNGFARTVNQEKKDYNFQVIELKDNKDVQADLVVKELFASDNAAIAIQYKNNTRFTEQITELNGKISRTQCTRENGVYVIAGGAGGIGFAIAGYLAEKGKVNLILTGRRKFTDKIGQKLDKLRAYGARVEYFSADISNEQDVCELIAYTKRMFGNIHGIISCAGVIKDARIVNKTEEDLTAVISAKTEGTCLLDQATRNEPLDFFFICSSLAGAIGNAGQCDYAYGNSYIDAFIRNREEQGRRGERQGISRSINWPLWEAGGMELSDSAVEWLRSSMGMEPLSTENGLMAFADSLSMEYANVIVLEGDKERIRQAFGVRPDIINASETERDVVDEAELIEKMNTYLVDMLSELVRLDAKRIKPDVILEDYGINSVLIMDWTDKLENTFGVLSKTLFFEYQTIEELSKYFCKNYAGKLMELFNRKKKAVKKPMVNYSEIIKAGREITDNSVKTHFEKQKIVNTADDIAIIGISGKYPMADNLEQFWKNLQNGKDCITKVPIERWDCEKHYEKQRGKYGAVYCKEGGFINDVDKFDPMFFNIAPLEADMMDPQERLLLETAWHAMEDAGYRRQDLSNRKVGVFVGVMSSHYQLLGVEETLKGNPVFPSSVYASISNRISYILNLCGPSITLDTMCSSALTALHLACQSIRLGESEMAFAGGVNVMIHGSKYQQLCGSGFLATDGRCHSFGDGGDGYGAAEGVGVLLMKPLSKAIEDGDYIYGVIKGSAINHDGKTNGYTVPNPNAQCEVIKEALQNARVNPETISYLEAHGTGTALGDPIEITGLTKAYSQYTDKKQFCAIGSVKSNMGHAESAAGMAALSKVLLQMKYGKKVPSIHSEVLNRNINFELSPVYVQRKLEDWDTTVSAYDGKKIPRRAGISAFGAGGVNAHVILEEYDNVKTENKDEEQIFVFSAKKPESLKKYLIRFLAFLEKNKEMSLPDMAYTLQAGREAMQIRSAVIAADRGILMEKIRWIINNNGVSSESDGIFINHKKEQAGVEGVFSELFDPDMIQKMYHNHEYKKLAMLWVSGFDVVWELFYGNEKRNRIPLPGYEFENIRCWIRETDRQVTVIQEKENSTMEETSKKQDIGKTMSTMDKLLKLIADVGRIPLEDIDKKKDLYEYGFDSIIALKLTARMESELGITADPSDILDAESIESLSELFGENTEYMVEENKTNVSETVMQMPLSEGQKSLWLIHQTSPENTAYILPFVFKVNEKLNISRLQKAFKLLTFRHSILRTVYQNVDNQLVQIDKGDMKITIEEAEMNSTSRDKLKVEMRDRAYKPFDLENGPLFRIVCFKDGENYPYILIVFHHIVFDLTSVVVLLKDLNELYYGAGNEEFKVKVPEHTYFNFVLDEFEYLKGNGAQKNKQYWFEKLSGNLPVLELPYDYAKPKVKQLKGIIYRHELEHSAVIELEKFSKRTKKSMFTVLLSVYNILLSKYTKQEDIIVGTPFSGRTKQEYEALIGYFVNMMALRSRISNELTFEEYMKNVQKDLFNSIANARYPFRLVVDGMGLNKDRSQNPVYNVAFAFQNSLRADYLGENPTQEKQIVFQLDGEMMLNQEGEMDLYLEIIENEGAYELLFKYNPDLFMESTIERMCNNYISILKAALDGAEKKLSDISRLCETESSLLLEKWNDTAQEFESKSTIPELFEETVKKYSEKTAIICKNIKMSYEKLNAKANRIAWYLKENGVTAETLVGILVNRDVNMMAAVLGVLKAGGTYVPIDPDYPKQRVDYILENAKVDMLLVSEQLDKKLELHYEGNSMDINSKVLEQYSAQNPENVCNPENLAYIIFTSGSTGNPKGVMIRHKAVSNLKTAMQKEIPFLPDRKMVALASIAFDMCIPEVILPLLIGQTILLADSEEQKNLDKLTELILKYRADMMQATPSRISVILRQDKWMEMFGCLKDVIIGAEGLPQTVFDTLAEKVNCNLYNIYGPTETTVWSLVKKLSRGEEVTVGRPLNNTEVYIAGPDNSLLPIGVAGELCIGGEGLARGYYGNVQVTDEKFIENPFVRGRGKIYKTGDLAKWTKDGNIAILGRIDRQVKIRGYRIELGEVENKITECEGVREAVAVAREEQSGGKVLYGYYTANKKVLSQTIRNNIMQKLPSYMIPSFLIQIDEIPLTPNGKLNVEALPVAKDEIRDNLEIVKPTTDTEKTVLKIWQEVLGQEQISVMDSFFEVGGESLLGIQIVSRLRNIFKIEIPFYLFFDNYTIRAFSEVVDKEYFQVENIGLKNEKPEEFETGVISDFYEESAITDEREVGTI